MSSVTDRYSATISDAEAQARIGARVPNSPTAVVERLQEIAELRGETSDAFKAVSGKEHTNASPNTQANYAIQARGGEAGLNKNDAENFAAKNAGTGGAITAIKQHERDDAAKKAALLKAGLINSAGNVADTLDDVRAGIFDGISNGTISLKAGNVRADGNGILRYHDKDGQTHELRPQDQAEMDHVDQSCSAGITTGAQEMNAYMRGETDDVPQSLKDMVPEGQSVEGLTRDDYEVMIREQLPAHIHQGILSNQPLQSPLNLEFTPGMFNTAAADGQPLSTPVKALTDSYKPAALGIENGQPTPASIPTPTSTPKLETLDM